MSETQSLGKKGEDLAAEHLESKGYKILHRNWISGRKEIDIVAENNEFVVFVEVKTRSRDMKLQAVDLVPHDKQRLMLFAADGYIRKYNINKESRFDIIIIIFKEKTFEIEHREGAFYPTLR
ncbi:MAG TPA: YraN family protein [Bacteroidales bacterium]|nr:YraN family protein [Bacteroidales bacterium]